MLNKYHSGSHLMLNQMKNSITGNQSLTTPNVHQIDIDNFDIEITCISMVVNI